MAEQRRVTWPAGSNHPLRWRHGVTEKIGSEERLPGLAAGAAVNSRNALHGEGDGGSGNWDMLTAEMKRYGYAIGEGGRISYVAPAGYHDDCVMALALANHGRWESESAGGMARLAASGRRGAVVSRRERQVVG